MSTKITMSLKITIEQIDDDDELSEESKIWKQAAIKNYITKIKKVGYEDQYTRACRLSRERNLFLSK